MPFVSMIEFRESHVESAALGWFADLGYSVLHGQDIAPGEPAAERGSYNDVVLVGRLQAAIDRLNPHLPAEAREEALRKALQPQSPALLVNNRAIYQMLRDGVEVEYRRADGSIAGDRARLVSDDLEENDWLVVNQFTVVEGPYNRRPDIVAFVNGLPIAVLEIKSALDEDATIWNAWNQLQTYQQQIPSLFICNGLLVISDGLNARIGVMTAGQEWFKPWRTIDGDEPAGAHELELEILIRGVFDRSRLVRMLKHYIAFEQDGEKVRKLMAGYHQFHAVEKAVEETVRASRAAGDRRCGVVWHTQGSGKSLAMTFYAGRIIGDERMENPTLIVLTDRNDLDDQLFGQFARCHELLRQNPVQSESRVQLQKLLTVAAGGVIFTTIQKFMPEEKGGVPAALRSAEYRRHRRRGPPQPIRLHRRLRPAPARCPAQCLVHRLYGHADRAGRQEHPRCVWRLHQHLRHRAGRARRRDRADLLREPHCPPGAGPAGAAQARPGL